MTKVIVAGAAGKMGRTILKLAHEDSAIKIKGAFERADHPLVGHDVGELLGVGALKVPIHPDIRECIDLGDVLIDFTYPVATSQHLKIALAHRRAMVIGTTGLTDAFLKELKKASTKIPIVQSANMSLGVNLLFRLAHLVAEMLDESYDAEIVEAHHRHKKDAPSGTALELVRQIAQARKIALDSNVVYGRRGEVGARKRGAIGVHAVRGGDVIGEHTVSFLTEGERLELIHRASSREAFAKGVLLAAKFVAKKRSGFYNMQQVLGL
ncbi:MAG: 4-hydroxy-tetrahydrodipicolinate reductase [Candidatus Omnitrophica bacterium]|nr:4-hydroxy-tetrahydrodipicolinate reductase [Candidatus Omnitrophota bacterium]